MKTHRDDTDEPGGFSLPVFVAALIGLGLFVGAVLALVLL